MVRLPLPHRRSGNRSPKIGAASSQDDLSASSTGTSETKYPLILKTQVISVRPGPDKTALFIYGLLPGRAVRL